MKIEKHYFVIYLKKPRNSSIKIENRVSRISHSCASLLLANGVPLKQIQEWMGHSDFSTTANIYAHLDYSSKISSACAMENGLMLPDSDNFASKWEDFAGI